MLDGKQCERAMRAHEIFSTVLERTKQIAVGNDAPFRDVAAKYDGHLENVAD